MNKTNQSDIEETEGVTEGYVNILFTHVTSRRGSWGHTAANMSSWAGCGINVGFLGTKWAWAMSGQGYWVPCWVYLGFVGMILNWEYVKGPKKLRMGKVVLG